MKNKLLLIVFVIFLANMLLAQTQVNVTLKNVHNGVNISGSTLGVDGINSSVPSGSAVTLYPGTNYTIRTSHKMFSNNGWMHHRWNNEYQNYLMHESYTVPPNDVTQKAVFVDYQIADFESTVGTLDGLQIHDPWYLDGDGIQPDDYRPLNTVADDGTHEVFEDQSYGGSSPYYKLKADATVVSFAHNESLTWYFEKWL